MPATLPTEPEVHNDAAWATSLLRSTLDGWLTAAPSSSGLFHPYLDRQWNRTEGGPLTLVSQSRLVYNFARGYEVFGEAGFADAAQRGLEALQTYFRMGPGLYRWAVTGVGVGADDSLDSYGHAFVVLALATAARAFGVPDLAKIALETWQAVSVTFTDEHGGLVWKSGYAAGPARSQNPMMHTFEALMALAPVDPTGEALAAARAVLRFVQSLSGFGAGMLIERYTPDWQPQPTERGGVVDLGHAFEWAFLLSEWAALAGDPDALRQGTLFLRAGMEHGLDGGGGVFASCDQEGRVESAEKGLWQQCEAVRALSRYAARHDAPGAGAALGHALSFYRGRFVDAEHGGVFAAPPRMDKGDAWKLDYHTVGMCLEVMAGGSLRTGLERPVPNAAVTAAPDLGRR